jgi:hypothetical protein
MTMTLVCTCDKDAEGRRVEGASSPDCPAHDPAAAEAAMLRERMRLHSQQPERDDEFYDEVDFPGTVVKAGAYGERSFAVGRECRVAGLTLPKGLEVVRIILKLGPRFRASPEAPEGVHRPYAAYEGEDCVVFEQEALRLKGWKTHRLVPELQGAFYLLVRNTTADDLRFEGTVRFAEDRVPEPEHQEI